MQFRSVAVSLFAAAAAAQSNSTLTGLVSQLPECANSCFLSSAKSAGCAATDFDCLCGDGRSKFISSITGCIITSSCDSNDLGTLNSLAGQICTEVSENPSSADVASASAIVTSALGTAAAAQATGTTTSTPNVAATPAAGIGMMGGAAILAALAL
ncbi:hypothetical protein JX266_004651 [Neoarthrinium moseri]|nr:hypothetical protein JX266_004651 [Neoarthrinium moseri]